MRRLRNRSLVPAAAGVLILAFGLGLAGCTPWATYPPIEGAAGIDNPGLSPIPELMSEAIWHVYMEDGRGGQIIYNLPESTPYVVYEKVSKKLDGGRPMQIPDEPAYHVTAVRVRTVEAEVDVIHPDDSGAPRLVTLAFRQEGLKGFRVRSERPWRFAVNFPEPTFVAPHIEAADASDAGGS